jgi:7,8-dihydropterin-6-yl-methyl-4-(beta-D-ribofuranosyl)aminobenzene 5'-phosphate synthase
MSERSISVLVENTAGSRGLLGEHGLSLWIENGDRRILFDTGQGTALRSNAEHLGIPLERADAIVLSHGHYDHTGGLHVALESAGRTDIYAHPAAFAPKFVRDADGSARDVGVPVVDQKAAQECGNRIPVESPREIANGFHVTGPVPRVTEFEVTDGTFFRDSSCSEPDLLLDDQAAFMESESGTIVILGCAHAGVINTLRTIRILTGSRPIRAVVGGMHLHSAGRSRLEKTFEVLRRLEVACLLPCHCTGFGAIVRLWNEFPGRCSPCAAGTVLKIRD